MSLSGQVLRIHEELYKRTDGRLGHRMIGVPTLLLRTTGRRSGATRTNGLVYARDGDDYLVVASNGGSPRSPGWYHNLKADPDIEINVGPRRFAVTAQPVLPGDPDRERLWKIVTKYNKSYNEYQKKTRRPIPIVRLTRKAGSE